MWWNYLLYGIVSALYFKRILLTKSLSLFKIKGHAFVKPCIANILHAGNHWWAYVIHIPSCCSKHGFWTQPIHFGYQAFFLHYFVVSRNLWRYFSFIFCRWCIFCTCSWVINKGWLGYAPCKIYFKYKLFVAMKIQESDIIFFNWAYKVYKNCELHSSSKLCHNNLS